MTLKGSFRSIRDASVTTKEHQTVELWKTLRAKKVHLKLQIENLEAREQIRLKFKAIHSAESRSKARTCQVKNNSRTTSLSQTRLITYHQLITRNFISTKKADPFLKSKEQVSSPNKVTVSRKTRTRPDSPFSKASWDVRP